MSIETIQGLAPELILVCWAVLVAVGGAFADKAPRTTWSILSGAGVLFASAALVQLSLLPSADLFAIYFRWLTLGVTFAFVLMTANQSHSRQAPEFYSALLLASAGAILVAGARELALMFVGLELVSIPTYLLLYIGRHDRASQESAAKYFYLSILSSALLLYGFSFLYGAIGSTSLTTARHVLFNTAITQETQLLLRVAMVFIFAGLGFRVAAAPFHFYAPDVYQGTSNFNAALLSVIPKIVGFAAFAKVLVFAMPSMETFGWRIALVLAILTMTIANTLALWQRNVRRMLAYSSIAHAGYMLIGLAVAFANSPAMGATTRTILYLDGIAAIGFYLAIYAAGTIGFFAALLWLGKRDGHIDLVDDLAGAGQTHPLAGLAISVFMFSLAGIPPLAGFWGKLAIFGGALTVDPSGPLASSLGGWFLLLAIVGVLNSAIAAWYYLRIIAVMYFRPAGAAPLPAEGGMGARLAMVGCLLVVLAISFYPLPLAQSAGAGSQSARDPLSAVSAATAQTSRAR